MNIALSPATQRMLEDQLRSGRYASPDDLVRAALQALHDQAEIELDELTLDAIDRAEDQIDAGQIHEWKDVREQVRAKFLGN